MSFVRIPNTGRVAACSKVILPVGRARLLAVGLPRGPEVRFEDMARDLLEPRLWLVTTLRWLASY